MKAPSGGAILSIRRSSPATSSALEKSCLGRRPKRRTDMPTGMGKPSYSLHCACMAHAVIFLLTAAATGKPSAIRAFGRREDQRIGDEAIVRASQEGWERMSGLGGWPSELLVSVSRIVPCSPPHGVLSSPSYLPTWVSKVRQVHGWSQSL